MSEGIMENKKKLPIKEGLWIKVEDTEETIRLVGSECKTCKEVHFPRCEMGFCSNCQSGEIQDIELSTRGTIYSHTVVMQRPPEYYKGPVPYAIGFVELPEGVRVQTLFTDCSFDDLCVGMDVELVLRTLYRTESGNDIESYMFRPVSG